MLGKKATGPSPEDIRARQEAAAQREREKIALEQAQSEASARQQQQASIAEATSRRKMFTETTAEEDTSNRRKFLKGV